MTKEMSPRDISGNEYGITQRDNEDGSSFCTSTTVVVVTQKVIAEVIGTYFLIFMGCGSVAVEKIYGSVTFPGICVSWGLTVMIMVYSVGHISGAHFNPAVTITFALFRHFPYKQVPLYILAQLVGSILASGSLYVLLDVPKEAYFGTLPVGSNAQSLVIEFIASFLLMFVISGVATDNRSVVMPLSYKRKNSDGARDDVGFIVERADVFICELFGQIETIRKVHGLCE
ncbi:Putative aquaporin NIP4-1 [Striga hermonthica]|uniref:Aquaporin NIP4-1 n=1 Tax=Striga hermonthica TaxID=68872 RepID=A0A9N7MS01_STRHE|nr:Putative aquaporin NIP4-1 [Striga hermonthica]